MAKSEPKLTSGQVVKWKEHDTPSVYSNLIGVGITPFEFSLIFGEIGDSTPTEVTGVPRVKIILAPEQVSNLIKLLEIALPTYVENNGQLRRGGAIDTKILSEQIKKQSAGVSE